MTGGRAEELPAAAPDATEAESTLGLLYGLSLNWLYTRDDDHFRRSDEAAARRLAEQLSPADRRHGRSALR
ncbi:hypothetical protein [Modestobacter sp. VKM Ac-2978]|uniref:hypothetical protein n=1 Tax=Modestobacter sp. VKM Ac-2978 TaxID=3004132 RepID=UPI0022AAEC22|nr:hypothetical protein [Modestobacter sp. VKM Ac-2978]MCZ2849855.1 hypothetical protein [Modestobacter sp. VKM Ac-2978]